MKVITFATKDGGALKYLEESFYRLSDSSRHEFIKVGWGKTWRGFGDRLIQYRNELSTIDSTEVCLVIDGYDVLLTGDMGSLEAQYKDSANGKVVFSTEIHSSISIIGNYFVMGAPVKQGNNTIRICAGAYIGTAQALIKMLNQVISTNECNHPAADDQYLLTKLCRKNPENYTYDIESEWFLTWSAFTDDLTKTDVTLSADGTLTYKKKHPFVLHRQFAADLQETILALGYEMTSADIEAVKRDPNYHYKFYRHHIEHRWQLIPDVIKFCFMIFLVVLFLIFVYYIYACHGTKNREVVRSPHVHWSI